MKAGPGPGSAGVPRLRAAPGFTLVELMVTLAVAAILVTMAVPGFTSLINSNRLGSSANQLVAAVQAARIEAVRRNARVIMCRSVDGATCAAAGDEWPAWIVFVDTDADGNLDAGETVVHVGSAHAQVQVRASNALTADRLLFRSDGFARDSASANGALLTTAFSVCMPTQRPTENERLVAIGSGSRITTVPRARDGVCATPPNNP